MKLFLNATDKRNRTLRERLELFLCAAHIIARKRETCDEHIALMCATCGNSVTPDDVQYDEPYSPCPHCGSNTSARCTSLCLSHEAEYQATRNREICDRCKKNHPHPEQGCLYEWFWERCCEKERRWDNENERSMYVWKCIKLLPREYDEWLNARLSNKTVDDDDWPILSINTEHLTNPDWLEIVKDVEGDRKRSRRSIVSVKRRPGKWKPPSQC